MTWAILTTCVTLSGCVTPRSVMVDGRSGSCRSSLSSESSSDARRAVMAGGSSSTAAALSPRSREYLRLRVNARERQRMHDMNLALDALRRAMPYAQVANDVQFHK